MAEESAITETKKIINPRVEIDTSPPFESVKEAVDRFGGSGPWIPHHLLRLAAHHDTEVFDVENMEEQALQLERDLIMKQRETLNVLKELEAVKRYLEGLKLNSIPEFSSFAESPDLKFENHNSTEGLSLCPILSPGLMFMELNQAKSNLNKTSMDLALIQASVESLNKKMGKERRTKMQIRNTEDKDQKTEVPNNPDISMTISKEVNFEAEQFKKMTEASRYEVMKAMAEIEGTKNSIKMAEMRLNAAKKMEEAAKAMEAISSLSNGDVLLHKSDEITLSLEEYKILTQKAQQAEELCKTKFIDTNGFQRTNEAHYLEVPVLEKFEETINENNSSTFKFRNSHSGSRNGNESNPAKQKSNHPGFRSKTSIGDILSRKLILRDDVVMERHVENHSEKEHTSLSQMLREQSRLILHPNKQTADVNVEKQYTVQRKKFGFIQVPIPTKQSKKKTQPLNLR
ncbi:hypothetical protein ACJIZ3_009509 [Penstemon smallii]|uniref:Uncharacterized protein n=1 Tax=Penstemon smallii TaxID=265156 RepID=A0ABD3TDY8_9LAMI